MATFKNTDNTKSSVGMWRDWNHYTSLVVIKYDVAILENFVSFLCPHTDLHVIIYDSIIGLNWKQLKYSPMMNKQNYTHKIEYDSSIKCHKVLINVITWMYLKNMLRE